MKKPTAAQKPVGRHDTDDRDAIWSFVGSASAGSRISWACPHAPLDQISDIAWNAPPGFASIVPVATQRTADTQDTDARLEMKGCLPAIGGAAVTWAARLDSPFVPVTAIAAPVFLVR